MGWDIGHDPALGKGIVYDAVLYVLNGDRWGVDAQHTGALARGGASAARELGEVVGLEQLPQGLLPVVLEDQVVPLGNDVAQGTAVARLTEGNSTIHAPT